MWDRGFPIGYNSMENMSAYSDQCFFEGEGYQGRNYLEKQVLQNVGFFI